MAVVCVVWSEAAIEGALKVENRLEVRLEATLNIQSISCHAIETLCGEGSMLDRKI